MTHRLSSSERLPLIEQAATKLFAEKGFAATTVDDIVREAGLTKPMLYRHFDSKQELCIALLERCRDELIAAPLSRFEPGATGDRRTRLETMLDAWLGYIEAHPEASRLLFTPISGDAGVLETQRELHVRQRDTQKALLREFVPEVEDSEVEPLAEIFRAGLAAIALWWLDHPTEPRAVPAKALLRLTDGVMATVDGPMRWS